MAIINPDEITSIIKEKLQNYDSKVEVKNVGTVLEVADGISRVYVLSEAKQKSYIPHYLKETTTMKKCCL